MLADAALHVEFPEHAHGQPWAEIHAQVIPSSKSTRRQEGLATGPCSGEDTQTDSEAELLIGGRTARKWLNQALDPARGGVQRAATQVVDCRLAAPAQVLGGARRTA